MAILAAALLACFFGALALWASFCLSHDWKGRPYMSWVRRHLLYSLGLIVVAFSFAWFIAVLLGSLLYLLVPQLHACLGYLWGLSFYPCLCAFAYYAALDIFSGYDYNRHRNQTSKPQTRVRNRD